MKTQKQIIPPLVSKAGWPSLAFVIALTLVTIGWLAESIQRHSTFPFDSDEAVHAYEALRVSAHLRDGDLTGAWDDTLRQSFYPPVHPWLLGTALSLVSATHVSVRLFSLAIYALDVLLLYALGRGLVRDTRFAWLAGLIASLLALASPPLWVTGSLVYLEGLGVLFVLVAFWGYWRAVKECKWGGLVAGAAAVAAGLTKYPYWLFLMLPLVTATVVQAWFWRGKLRPSQGWGALVGRLASLVPPSAVVMLMWIALPATRSGLADFIAAQQDLARQAPPSFMDHLTFYFKSVWLQFSSSPLVAVGLAVAFALSLVRWRDVQLWPLALFFTWHLIGISTHGGLAPRFLVTAMPALWLMGGVWAARAASAWPGWIAQLKPGSRWAARMATWMALVALVLTSILGLAWRVTLYPTLYLVSLETDSRAQELYQWIAEQIPAGPARIGLVNDWDQMSGPALGWELTTRRAPNHAPRRADLVTVWEMHRLPEPTPENVALLRDQMNVRELNYIIAYMAPGTGIKRLQGMLAILGDQVQLVGERNFPLRWYWPNKFEHRLYDGESLDEAQLQEAIDQLGTDRELTVHIYAYRP